MWAGGVRGGGGERSGMLWRSSALGSGGRSWLSVDESGGALSACNSYTHDGETPVSERFFPLRTRGL